MAHFSAVPVSNLAPILVADLSCGWLRTTTSSAVGTLLGITLPAGRGFPFGTFSKGKLVGVLLAMILGLLSTQTNPTIRVPTRSACGVAYHPLYEMECDRCWGGLVVMECPSCLD